MAKRSKSDPMIHASRADGFLLFLGHGPTTPRVRYHGGDFYVWMAPHGPWVRTTDDEMKGGILRWLIRSRQTSNAEAAGAIVAVLKAMLMAEAPRAMDTWASDGPPGQWLAVANGLIQPGGSTTLSPPDSRWFSVVQVPVEYDPTAECPRWLEFIGQALDGDPSKIALLQEWFGYCISGRTDLHAGLFVVGPSGSGKSTVANVLRRWLGPNNTCSLALEKWDSEFALRETEGKLLNLCDETQRKINSRTEAFLKWYLSGSEMLVNGKYSRYIALRPTARLVVCTNHWPDFHDNSDGIWRRILPLRMRRVVAPEQRDPRLAESFDGEHSGILNWALAGLDRLNRTNLFTVNPEGTTEVTNQKADVQTHREWAGDRVHPDSQGFVPLPAALGDYRQWCTDVGYKPQPCTKDLRNAVFERAPGARWVRARVGAVRPYGFQGVVLGEPSG